MSRRLRGGNQGRGLHHRHRGHAGPRSGGAPRLRVPRGGTSRRSPSASRARRSSAVVPARYGPQLAYVATGTGQAQVSATTRIASRPAPPPSLSRADRYESVVNHRRRNRPLRGHEELPVTPPSHAQSHLSTPRYGTDLARQPGPLTEPFGTVPGDVERRHLTMKACRRPSVPQMSLAFAPSWSTTRACGIAGRS